jgi:tetratricopeptide (TPR) repeat protein
MLQIAGANGPARSSAELRLTLDGMSALVPMPRLEFTTWEQESVRWYLEDFREFPADPATALAAASRKHIERLGEELFRAVFLATSEAAALWAAALPRLGELAVTIDADLAEVVPVPFEMLREPGLGTRPALDACSFTHVPADGGGPLTLSGSLRILLVICRPDADQDVPFRTIGGRLVRATARNQGPRVDVLRPPGFAAMEQTLRAAAERGEPYQILHFDGHGIFGTKEGSRPQGYAIFENPDEPGTVTPVNGTELGRVLAANGVDALVLNACSSGRVLSEESSSGFSSLARNALAAGLSTVIAMRYNLYVSTATAYVHSLYDSFFAGKPLAEAATWARRELARQADTPQPQDDWLVPVVLQARPVRMATTWTPGPRRASRFVGRDDITITIDRAFDSASAVLLWGAAGVGKSATAAEFARWYEQTGGVSGPVHVSDLTRDESDLRAEATRFGAEPVLWVWDGLDQDRSDLADLVAELSAGPTKVLITAHSPLPWLPPDVERVHLRSLSAVEQAEFVRTLTGPAEQPVLDFCQGNPLALTLLPGNGDIDVAGLFDGSRKLGAVAGLRTGELAEDQRHALSLLLFFRDTVAAHHLPRLGRRVGVELDFAAATALLDWVADLGLLERLDAGYHRLSPFLHAELRPLLEAWADVPRIRREYCRFFAAFGNGLFWAYNVGDHDVLNIITLEEANLRHAWQTALDNGWHDEIIGPMQALRMLYVQGHRKQMWLELVTPVVSELVDPDTCRPVVRFNDVVLNVILLDYAEDLAESRSDQAARALLREVRQELAAAAAGTRQDDEIDRWAVRHRAIELLDSESEDDLRAALDLSHRIDDRSLEVSALIRLGHHYRTVNELHRAQLCFEEALNLVADDQPRELIRVFAGFGAVQLRLFDELVRTHVDNLVASGAIDTSRPGFFDFSLTEEHADALQRAEKYYSAALNVQGVDDWATTAPIHHELAGIAGKLGDWPEADTHYRKAIEGHDQAGDPFHAAQSRCDFANHLVHRGQRYPEALAYATTALRQLESIAGSSAAQLESARELVSRLSEYV